MPRMVPNGSRRLTDLDDMVISLYAGGITVRDIEHHLATTIGVNLSPNTISAVTDAVLEEVTAWQTRQLDEFYPVIFLDALRVKSVTTHASSTSRSTWLSVWTWKASSTSWACG